MKLIHFTYGITTQKVSQYSGVTTSSVLLPTTVIYLFSFTVNRCSHQYRYKIIFCTCYFLEKDQISFLPLQKPLHLFKLVFIYFFVRFVKRSNRLNRTLIVRLFVKEPTVLKNKVVGKLVFR